MDGRELRFADVVARLQAGTPGAVAATGRELQVAFRAFIEHRQYAEVARELAISERTVQEHLRRFAGKLDLKTARARVTLVREFWRAEGRGERGTAGAPAHTCTGPPPSGA